MGKTYGEIQAETILNGGTIEDAEKIYQEQLKNHTELCGEEGE